MRSLTKTNHLYHIFLASDMLNFYIRNIGSQRERQRERESEIDREIRVFEINCVMYNHNIVSTNLRRLTFLERLHVPLSKSLITIRNITMKTQLQQFCYLYS